jgi:hypothetical protein
MRKHVSSVLASAVIPAALAAAALAACKPDEDYKKQQPPPEPASSAATGEAAKPPPPPKKKALSPEELGTCQLTATGAIAKEQTTQGGRAATNVTYWMKPEDRKNMMGTDGFAVSCHGPDIKFSLIPGSKKDGMPFKPKKYDFVKGKGDAGVMVLFGKATLEDITGAVDVSAFDAHHIAGTIDLKGKLVPGGGEVKLAGSFDLVCPGFSACE